MEKSYSQSKETGRFMILEVDSEDSYLSNYYCGEECVVRDRFEAFIATLRITNDFKLKNDMYLVEVKDDSVWDNLNTTPITIRKIDFKLLVTSGMIGVVSRGMYY